MKKMIRVCALWHEACGVVKTKVIFREGGHNNFKPRKTEPKEVAYWMDREVYNAIPIMQEATPEDFQKFGKLVLAQDLNIYSNL